APPHQAWPPPPRAPDGLRARSQNRHRLTGVGANLRSAPSRVHNLSCCRICVTTRSASPRAPRGPRDFPGSRTRRRTPPLKEGDGEGRMDERARVERFEIESRLLRGNPLGDPHRRQVHVLAPPVDPAPSRRLPVLYVLPGFSSVGASLL